MFQLVVVVSVLFFLADAAYFESEWTSPDEYYRVKEYCMKKKENRDVFDDYNPGSRRALFIGSDDVPIPPQIKVSNVVLTTCSSMNMDPLKVEFKVLGDVLLPGFANLAFNITSNIDIVYDIVTDVEMNKRILGDFVRVPCMNKIGSCSYVEKCDSLKNKTCSDEFIRENIPCSCPLPKGQFLAENLKLHFGITEISDIPDWLTNGHYTAEINIRSGSQRLTCLKAAMDVETLNPKIY